MITNLIITRLTVYIIAEAEIITVETYVIILEIIPRAINQNIAKINVKRDAIYIINQITSLLGILLTNNNKYIPNSAIIQNIYYIKYL
jgi:hypothetical protein